MPKKLAKQFIITVANIVFGKKKNQERCPHKFFTTDEAENDVLPVK